MHDVHKDQAQTNKTIKATPLYDVEKSRLDYGVEIKNVFNDLTTEDREYEEL